MSNFLKLCYALAVAGVFAVSVIYLRGSAPGPTGNIHILSRLDDYTRAANPTIVNTIPTFLMQRGNVGIVSGEWTPIDNAEPPPIPVETVKPVNEVELRKGFCTASLTRLVREQYPGVYDDLADEELVKSVLKQHPEYKDRVCILPVWVVATPHEIVKYEVEPQSPLAIPRSVLIYASAITAVFAVAAFIALRRLT